MLPGLTRLLLMSVASDVDGDLVESALDAGFLRRMVDQLGICIRLHSSNYPSNKKLNRFDATGYERLCSEESRARPAGYGDAFY